MDSRCTALCAALFATLVSPAHAASHWICGISSEGTRLICVADADPAADPAAKSDAVSDSPTATVNGTRFPLDASRVYTVYMWSTPTEADFVIQLARSTICYRSPGCQVSVALGPWLAALHATARR
jgi:hypothetical protein